MRNADLVTMCVAFLAHATSLFGANRSLLGLVEGLREYSVRPCVVIPSDGELRRALANRMIPHAVVRYQQWFGTYPSLAMSLYRLGLNALSLLPLIKRLRRWDTDIVYTNSALLPTGIPASKRLGVPHIWHLRELVDVAWDGPIEWGGAFDWGLGTFRHFVSLSERLVAVSEAVRDELLEDPDQERTHVVPSGVASEAHFEMLRERAREKPVDSRPFTFSLVGEISPRKGQEIAIQALALLSRRFPDSRLLIAGSGRVEHVRRCKALARRLGITDKVDFLGYVEDPFQTYLASDAALMCSRREAFGRVTAEAMAACRPVIGYRGGGTPEVIEEGETGVLFEGGPSELASCMERLVERPDWSRELGMKGWEVARRKYTTERYAETIYEILRSVH